MDTLELIRSRLALTCLLMSLLSQATAQIDKKAPVQTQDTVIIDAPVEAVWQIMTDINGWPKHFDFIRKVQAPVNLQQGTSFQWRTNRLKLTSTLLTVSPTDTLGWVGGRYGVTVHHYWYFQALANRRTRVISAESQRGLIIRLLKKQFHQSLQEGSQKWLRQLKYNCETHP